MRNLRQTAGSGVKPDSAVGADSAAKPDSAVGADSAAKPDSAVGADSAAADRQPRRQFKRLLPFVMFLLLASVPLTILFAWRREVDRTRVAAIRSQWSETARQRAAAVQHGFSYEKQLEQMHRRVYNAFQSRLNDPSKAAPEQWFRRLVERIFPKTHLPGDAELFLFVRDRDRPAKVLSGPGLATSRGRLMAMVVPEFERVGGLSGQALLVVQKRAATLFGKALSLDSLALNRRGQVCRAPFSGRESLLLWDAVKDSSGRTYSWLLVLSPPPAAQRQATRFALQHLAWAGSPSFAPVLVPLGSCRSRLPMRSLALAPHRRARSAIKEALQHTTDYATVASLSVTTEIDNGVWIQRSLVHAEVPYELWLVNLHPTRLFVPSTPWDLRFAVLLLLLGAGIFTHFLSKGVTIHMPVRVWVSLFLLLTSTLPLTVLWSIGEGLINTMRESRINERLQRVRQEFKQLDIEIYSMQPVFTEQARSLLRDRETREMLLDPSSAGSEASLRRAFPLFSAHGIDLELAAVYPFGSPTVVLEAPGLLRSLRNPVRSFHLPIMYGVFKLQEPALWEQSVARMSQEERAFLDIYKLGATDQAYFTYSQLRQTAQISRFGPRTVFIFQDYLADHDAMQIGLVFQGSATEAFVKQCRPLLSGLSLQIPGAYFTLWRWTDFGWDRWNVARLPGSERDRPQRVLSHLLDTSAQWGQAQMLVRGAMAWVSHPLANSPGVVLGAIVSLQDVFDQARRQRDLLLFLCIAFLSVVLAITRVLSAFFLEPVQQLESELLAVNAGNFERQLTLTRADEIGDVATAFNSMTSALTIRQELGRFVSGLLERKIRSSASLSLAAQTQVGAVLVSDIRSFTTMSETYPPETMVEVLNTHLDAMARIIQQQDGLIDKFIGDAIIAVFLGDNPEKSAHSAITTAQLMLGEHSALQRQRQMAGVFTYGIGIGVDIGELTIATIGQGTRKEFAMFGEPRTTAETLEGMSRTARFMPFLVSPRMLEVLPDLRVLQLTENAFEVLEVEEA